MIKKIISFIMMVFVLYSATPITVGAADEKKFEPSEHGEAVAFLRDLNLLDGIDEANSGEKSTITRAEFVTLVIRVMGLADVAESSVYRDKYSDVPSSYSQAKSIIFATDAGLLSGTSQTAFSPDELVYSNQAIKVAVIMLGYKRHAEEYGGYPNGYLKVASNIKLLDGLTNMGEKVISRGEIFKLLYNAIKTDILIEDGIGDVVSFNVYKGRNIMTEYLDIFKEEGIVTADNDIAIKGKTTTIGGSIIINDKEYLNNINPTRELVGKNIICYYKEINGENQIVTIREKQNDVVVLSARDIDKFDYANGIYSILDSNDKAIHFNIGKSYDVVYNGELLDGSDPDLMLPTVGTVTLIDNNKDLIYDVIFVNEYYNLIVDRYDSYKNIIFDKKGDEIVSNGFTRDVVIGDYNNISALTDQSKKFDYASLAPDNIVIVYKNRTKDSLKLYLSTKTVIGIVNQLDEEENKITVDNIEYKLSGDLRFNQNDLKVGFMYTFYLNNLDEIVYSKIDNLGISGYVLDISSKLGISDKVKVKILAGSSVRVYQLADKVRILEPGGTTSISSDKIESKFPSNKRAFVMFELNEKREISRFIFPYLVKSQDEYESMGSYPFMKLDYIIEQWPGVVTSKTTTFRRETKGFDNWLILDDKASIFNVPPITEMYYDDDDLSVINVSAFRDKTAVTIKKTDTGGLNEIEVYSVGLESIRSQMLVRHFLESGKIDEDSTMSLVSNVVMVQDDKNDQPTYKLTIFENGQEKEIVLKDPNIITTDLLSKQTLGSDSPVIQSNKTIVKKGDIIKYNIASVGDRVNAVALLYDSENKKLSYAKTNYDSLFRVISGKIKRVENGCIEMLVDTIGGIERTLISTAKIVVYDEITKRTYNGKMQDIAKGDTVVIYSRYVDNKYVVVYKGGN